MAKFPELAKGIYRHNKTGNRYEVIGVALQTETNEALVIYQPLDGGSYDLYARPHAMFSELVEINGQMMPRFEKVDTPRTFVA